MSEAAVSTAVPSGESSAPVSSEVSQDTSSEVNSEVSSESELPSEPQQASPSLYSVKVNGVDVKMTLDELMKNAQLGTSAHQRFQEAAKLSKDAQEKLSRLKQDPIQAALEAGVSPEAFREMVEKYLYNQIKYDEMTPEQKELAELKRYKEEMDKRSKDEEENQRTAKHQKEVEHYQNQYVNAYQKAFAEAKLPVTENAIQRVAQIQLDALEAGWDMPTDIAIQHFQQEQQSSITSFINGLDPDRLEELIGKDKMQALRKKEIAKLKNPVSSKPAAKADKPTKSSEKIPMSKFFDTLKR